MSVIEEIEAERKRQVEVEGWNAEHDRYHSTGEIALAAATYAYAATLSDLETEFHRKALYGAMRGVRSIIAGMWPWEAHWFKPKGKRRNLILAGALIIAEIERLDACAKRAALTAQLEKLGRMMLSQEAQIERLTLALRSACCPGGGYTGQPSDEEPTVDACLKAGVCGCDLGAALATPSSAPKQGET